MNTDENEVKARRVVPTPDNINKGGLLMHNVEAAELAARVADDPNDCDVVCNACKRHYRRGAMVDTVKGILLCKECAAKGRLYFMCDKCGTAVSSALPTTAALYGKLYCANCDPAKTIKGRDATIRKWDEEATELERTISDLKDKNEHLQAANHNLNKMLNHIEAVLEQNNSTIMHLATHSALNEAARSEEKHGVGGDLTIRLKIVPR